jgi:beta-glucosidase
LLYLSDKVASITPGKGIKTICKISLAPNETKTVSVYINSKDLQFVGDDLKWIAEKVF